LISRGGRKKKWVKGEKGGGGGKTGRFLKGKVGCVVRHVEKGGGGGGGVLGGHTRGDAVWAGSGVVEGGQVSCGGGGGEGGGVWGGETIVSAKKNWCRRWQ